VVDLRELLPNAPLQPADIGIPAVSITKDQECAMSQPAEIEEVSPPYPMFEGKEVKGVSVKISQLSALTDTELPVFKVDDRLRLVGAFKCIGVRHFVDKNGDMVREQVVVPIELEPCPWDPTDPLDDGVLRSRT
jgi:hypothetical protein